MSTTNGPSSKKRSGLLALQANEATITTTAVTIRTLRVGARQLTQAVFRQLPVRELIDPYQDPPKLLGVVWGWVNYVPSGESEDKRQFVAQFGEELCRCPVDLRPADRTLPGDFNCDAGQFRAVMEKLVGVRLLSGKYKVDDLRKAKPHWSVFINEVRYPTVSPFVNVQDVVAENLGTKGTLEYWRPEYYLSSPERIKTALCVHDSETEESLLAEARQLQDYFEEFAPKWDELIERLKSAPQLFIAC